MISIFDDNIQNVWNLTGWEEYNIGRFALSVTILYSTTKKPQRSISIARKQRNLRIKNELMIN